MNRFLKHLTTISTFEWLNPFFNETQYLTSNLSGCQKTARPSDGIKNEDNPFSKNSATLGTTSSHRPNPPDSFKKNKNFKRSKIKKPKKLPDKFTKEQAQKKSPQKEQRAFHVEEDICFTESAVVKKKSKKRKTQQGNLVASSYPPVQVLVSANPIQNISLQRQVPRESLDEEAGSLAEDTTGSSTTIISHLNPEAPVFSPTKNLNNEHALTLPHYTINTIPIPVTDENELNTLICYNLGWQIQPKAIDDSIKRLQTCIEANPDVPQNIIDEISNNGEIIKNSLGYGWANGLKNYIAYVIYYKSTHISVWISRNSFQFNTLYGKIILAPVVHQISTPPTDPRYDQILKNLSRFTKGLAGPEDIGDMISRILDHSNKHLVEFQNVDPNITESDFHDAIVIVLSNENTIAQYNEKEKDDRHYDFIKWIRIPIGGKYKFKVCVRLNLLHLIRGLPNGTAFYFAMRSLENQMLHTG